MAWNCSSSESTRKLAPPYKCVYQRCYLPPPTSRTHRRSVPRPSSFTTFRVWRANSLDGERTTARAPTFTLCVFNFSIMGITNAAVFPDPVLAIPTTSWPSRMSGIAFRLSTKSAKTSPQTLLPSSPYSLYRRRNREPLSCNRLQQQRIQPHSLEPSALLHSLAFQIRRFPVRCRLPRRNKRLVVGPIAANV